MVTYTNEHEILSDLYECFKNGVEEIDIDLYELIDNYILNPFNMSEDDLNQIKDFIFDNKKEPIKFNVEALAPNEKTLSDKLEHIKPSKLNKPTAPIIRMYGKCPYKTVIPIYTNAKELKLAA